MFTTCTHYLKKLKTLMRFTIFLIKCMKFRKGKKNHEFQPCLNYFLHKYNLNLLLQ